MIIDLKLLQVLGIQRTHDTMGDALLFFEALKNSNNVDLIIATLKQNDYPFYRFFSNYGTGIGETIEAVVAKKFTDTVPKKIGKKKSPIYEAYNKSTGKKTSNYDMLLQLPSGQLVCFEEKVIRAAESKPNNDDKIYEIPSLLEERALTFSEGSKSGNGSFQQTKAEMFDYLLGVVIYADQVDFYLVPSGDIKSGKLKITNQHAGAIKEDGTTSEGHLSVKELDDYKFLSVHTELELLAPDLLSKYIK